MLLFRRIKGFKSTQSAINFVYLLTLIHQLQLPDLSDRQKAEIIADFLSAAIHLNVHCGEDFQTLVAEEMAKLSDVDEEDSEQRNQVFT